MRRNIVVSCLAFFTLCLCSCGGQFESAMTVDEQNAGAPAIAGWDNKSVEAFDDSGSSGSSSDIGGRREGENGEFPSRTERKIIYTASLGVVVEQFDGVEQQITRLVENHDGFVASANLGRMQGYQRSGNWTVRVPVDRFDDFLNAVGDIGVPESRTQNASDVTEEFVDVTARIENKKKLEARILELLDRPEDKIQHVIEVERELGRVREEIERMEGRMRFLTDQTSLTTVTISIREERDYVPEQAPTFTSRITSAWNASLINCRRFFENATVFVVGNAIGFGIFLVFAMIGLYLLKKIYRYFRRAVRTENEVSAEAL